MRNPARYFLLISAFVLNFFSACQPQTPPEPTPEPSTAPSPAHTSTAATTSIPMPTPIALPVVPRREEPLFAWPPPALTDEQINASRECRIIELYQERHQFLKESDPQAYLAAYPPQDDCDWILFTSLAAELYPEAFTASGQRDILQNAVYQNPALLFASPGAFFTANYYLDIVPPPPFTAQPLSQIEIHYDWQGIGDAVLFEFLIEITDKAWITGQATYGDRWDLENQSALTIVNVDQEIPLEIVQPFGTSLGNLIPVESQGEFFLCYDNYPNWVITLTYVDGTTLELLTNHSNIFDMGGPFQTHIDGQNYVLGSLDFQNGILGLLEQLELKLGCSLAISCFDRNYVDLVFPQP